jgi:replicative DNA helicase
MNIVDVERTVLATLLIDNDKINQINLSYKDFYFEPHQDIYNQIVKFYKEKNFINEEFLVNNISSDSQSALLDIYSTNPVSNIEALVSDINEASKKRAIENELNSIRKDFENKSSTRVLLEIEKRLNRNSEIIKDTQTINLCSVNSFEGMKPKFYLEDIVPIQKNEINFFSAKGGTGKSWVLLYILAKLELEENLKCFGWFSEDSIYHTQDRLSTLSKVHTSFKKCKFDITDDIAQFFVRYDLNRNLVQSDFFYQFKKSMKDYDVICLDPLIAFFGGDENSNTEARFFMNLLNDWCKKENKTILMIHHHSKGESGTVRGATAFIDAVRLHYVISKKEIVQKEEVFFDDSRRVLKIEKTNHFWGRNEFEVQLFESDKIIKDDTISIENIEIIDSFSDEKSDKKPSVWNII